MRIRAASLCAVVAFAGAADVFTQTRIAAFDVVSVKTYREDPSRRPGGGISILPGGRFSAPSATLRALITTAYGLLDIQVIDSGQVLGTNRFDIEGRTRADVSVEDALAMMRSMLAERFGLVTHRETRELPVYVMSLSGTAPGPQLRPSSRECAPFKGPNGTPAPPPPPGPPPGENVGRVLALNGAASRCGTVFFNSTAGAHWSLRETTMTRVADWLTELLGRRVLNRTGISDAVDVDLTYLPDNPLVDAPNAANAPSLMAALREQLGVRLESTRAPVDVLVIDRVQPPTEN